MSNCTQLTGVGEQFTRAMAAASSGGKFDLTAVQKAYQGLANAAPSAIKSDIEAIASAFTAYVSAIQKAGYKLGQVPSATQIAQLAQAAKSLDTSQLKNASKAIEGWAAANCK